jgi:hypothetical protein
MTNRHRNILYAAGAVMLAGMLMYVFSIEDRIRFYFQTRNLPLAPLTSFNADATSMSPNINLGFIGFYLELSPDASFKKNQSTLTIKDHERTLVINLPELLGEMKLDPNHSDDLQDFDRLTEKYGNIVRARKAAYEYSSNLSVLFCSDDDFRCYKSLVMMRLIPAPAYEKCEYISTPQFDASITTYSKGKLADITWCTSQGKRKDQRQGVILLTDTNLLQNSNWSKQFISSLVVHPQGEIPSIDEMATRLERLKQPTRK